MAGQHRDLVGTTRLAIARIGNGGFGFSIVGGGGAVPGRPAVPVLVTRVKPGSPAARAGMAVGSAIVAVNSRVLAGLSHQEVVELIKNAPAESVFHVRDAQVHLRHVSAMGAYIPARDSVHQQVLVPVASYERVEVLHAYKAAKADEIDLTRGDIIHVTRKGSDGWCYGENQRTKLVGLFPGNFVVRIRDAPAAESIYQTLPEEDASPRADLSFRIEPLYASLDEPATQPDAEPAVVSLNPFTSGGGAAADGKNRAALEGPALVANPEALYSAVRKPVYAVVNKRRASQPEGAAAAAGPDDAGERRDSEGGPRRASGDVADAIRRESAEQENPYTMATEPEPLLASSPSVRERAKRFEASGPAGVPTITLSAPESEHAADAAVADDASLRRADDDCYARLDDFVPTEAPPIPVRRYDLSQLPLSINPTPPGSRMSRHDDPSYEVLPDLKAHTDQGDSDDEHGPSIAFNKDTVTYDLLPFESAAAQSPEPVSPPDPRELKRLAKEQKTAESRAKKEAEKAAAKEKKRLAAEAKAQAEREKKERKEREKEEKEQAKKEKERLKKEKSGK